MNVTYATALLRYCNDLTDPDAENIPVAAFLMAKTDDSYYAAAAGFTHEFFSKFFEEAQILSESMLEDLPHLIKRHVNEVFSSQEDVPALQNVLYALESALRNTLNVSDISEIQERVVGENLRENLGPTLLNWVTELLIMRAKEALAAREPHEAHRRPRFHVILGSGRSQKRDYELQMPMQNFWPLRERPPQQMTG